MNSRISDSLRLVAIGAFAPLMALCAVPLAAQDMERVDPDTVIDADLLDPAPAEETTGGAYDGAYEYSEATPRYETEDTTDPRPTLDLPPMDQGDFGGSDLATVDVEAPPAATANETTYGEDDLIGAAEGLFGQGAEGLARLIQDILADQGEPNGYIVGREAGGAFVLGVRYGSGTLYHSVEGNMPVYWTGPSIGIDAGANAGNTFVLVYNLYDTEELYERFPAGEGQAYFVGGFTASYVRKGDIVLIPIRVGAGLRAGVNAGYLKLTEKADWLPF